MLMDCIEIYKKYAGSDLDKPILDNYSPADGLYIIMKENDTGFEEKEVFEVKQDKKTKETSLSTGELHRISQLDYYCKLVDMNKPIDNKKIIQSNNYLSFWIKKESLSNGKLTMEVIDNYYKVLMNPDIKYKKTQKDKEIYQLVEKEVGSVNLEKLDKVKKWVKENIFSLPYEIVGKDYLKIFFLCEDADIEKEDKRYILPNIFNKNDFNIILDETIYGLPNENMGLNSKKPYLENKNRKYFVPTLTDMDSILLRKKFFDYLWGQASKRKYNIYFNSETNEIIPLDGKSAPKSPLTGYYIRIRKDKNEAAIEDMDCIGNYNPELKKPFVFLNILDLDTKKLDGHEYRSHKYLWEIQNIVNEELFSKFLIPNLFNEPKDISCNDDAVLEECILLSRNTLHRWFFKGYDNDVAYILDKVSMRLIKNSILNNNMIKVQHQFNLYISLMKYLKGGYDDMADVMIEIRESLRGKINQKNYVSIETDAEYFYATGQLINYFISLNKSNKKMHSLFNPFLLVKNDVQLKEKLAKLFTKYNYTIEVTNPRFQKMYSMITSYMTEKEIIHNYLIAGYISNNLLYEKRED